MTALHQTLDMHRATIGQTVLQPHDVGPLAEGEALLSIKRFS